MGIVKVLGFLDLVCIIVIILAHYDLAGWRWILPCMFYLLYKGIIFRGSFLSTLDLAVGAYCLLLLLGVSFWFTWVAVVILLNKVVFGMFL